MLKLPRSQQQLRNQRHLEWTWPPRRLLRDTPTKSLWLTLKKLETRIIKGLGGRYREHKFQCRPRTFHSISKPLCPGSSILTGARKTGDPLRTYPVPSPTFSWPCPSSCNEVFIGSRGGAHPESTLSTSGLCFGSPQTPQARAQTAQCKSGFPGHFKDIFFKVEARTYFIYQFVSSIYNC